MERRIIDELNRERDRELVFPFLTTLFILPFITVVLMLLYIFSPEIDAFATRHNDLVGWGMFLIGLVGIVWREVKR